MSYDVKQVLIFRKDLNMRMGKVAAQIAHGSLKVFLDRKIADLSNIVIHEEEIFDNHSVISLKDFNENETLILKIDKDMMEWVNGGFAKIVLSVDSEADLDEIYKLAEEAGLPTCQIIDSGKTEFHGVPTKTVVAIGPAKSELIDKITGKEGKVKCKLA